MKSATEMLQMALDACGDAANDHDYICECRPVDVRRVLAEIERLRVVVATAIELLQQRDRIAWGAFRENADTPWSH